jgi:hypothetical protein
MCSSIIPTKGTHKDSIIIRKYFHMKRKRPPITAAPCRLFSMFCYRFISEIVWCKVKTSGIIQAVDRITRPQGNNSLFTGHLLQGLSGAAVDENGILTANGLMHYVYQKLMNDPISNQTPHYGHFDGDGDFIFVSPDNSLVEPLEHDQLVKTVSEASERPKTISNGLTQAKPSFSELNGYSNPQSPTFGRNSFSNRLGTFDREQREPEKAYSWLGLVIEPNNEQNITINLISEAKRFENYSPQGVGQMMRFPPPRELMTTISSVILYDRLKYDNNNFWARYFRIEKSGCIEFCDSCSLFYTYKDIKAFQYVQIIGAVWQFMFFAKYLLSENGYLGGARLSVNLIGTKETILTNFAKGAGKDRRHWTEPGENGIWGDEPVGGKQTCFDSNLQMQYNLVLENLNEQSSKEIINDLAGQLGLAYNHQSEPRCFVYGTDQFPWNQYQTFR